jgi:hypothetical protein
MVYYLVANKFTAFMFHIPAHVAITDYALNRVNNRHGMLLILVHLHRENWLTIPQSSQKISGRTFKVDSLTT